MIDRPLYALLRDRCGLSLSEAAEFHQVRLNTLNKWSSGARNAPDGALDELRELYERIEKAASSGNEAEIAALPCEGARDAARGLADLWADE